jgi:hypothetical protein
MRSLLPFIRNLRDSRPVNTGFGRQNVPGTVQNAVMDLGRAAWLFTVVVCLVTALILLLDGYYGYAVVTFAVALAGSINLPSTD